jgi:RND family efflux transporter MFP subunit
MLNTNKVGLLLIYSSVLLLVMSYLSVAASSQERVSSVGVDKVISEPLLQTMPVIGRFIAKESGIVATRIAERVYKMMVQVGDRVEEGDVVAKLASDRLNSRIKLLLSDLRRMESQLAKEVANDKKMAQTHKRILALRSSNAFRKDREQDSERDLEITGEMVSRAKADIARANANLTMGQIALEDAKIIAPYQGVVVKRHTIAGNYVRVGDPIITLLNDTDLEIEADVPSIRALELKANTKVKAKLQNGLSFNAYIRAVIPQENSQTRALAVRLNISDGPHTRGLTGNQSVTLQIPIGKSTKVITVHKDAVLVKNGKKMVFIVKQGKVSIQPTELGRAAGSRFEVLDGLKPGDVVVIRGNERLRPGESVKPNPPR